MAPQETHWFASFLSFFLHNSLSLTILLRDLEFSLDYRQSVEKRQFKDLNFQRPSNLKPSCDTLFQHAFTACCCVYRVEHNYLGLNQGNHFENTTTCFTMHVEKTCSMITYFL